MSLPEYAEELLEYLRDAADDFWEDYDHFVPDTADQRRIEMAASCLLILRDSLGHKMTKEDWVRFMSDVYDASLFSDIAVNTSEVGDA